MASRRSILELSQRTSIQARRQIGSRTRTIRYRPSANSFLRHRSAARCCAWNLEQRRWHTTPPELKPGKQYDFDGVKKIVETPAQDIILIDVREPHECANGYIPNAFNVPIQSHADAFHLAPDEFFDQFGFDKPPLGQEIVVYCKSGVRSRAAAQLAKQNGYQNVAEYPGSWLDWTKNGGTVSKS